MKAINYRVNTTVYYGIRVAGFKGEACGEEISGAWYPSIEIDAEGEFGGRYRLPHVATSFIALENAKSFLQQIFTEWCEMQPNGEVLLDRVRAVSP